MRPTLGRSQDRTDELLDARLRGIFADRLTPRAPDNLYSFMREVAMTPEPSAGWRSRIGGWIAARGRLATSIAAVVVIAAGALAVVGLSRGIIGGTGTGPESPAPLLTPPPATSGWHSVTSIGSPTTGDGSVGSEFPMTGDQTVAVHVVCTGLDDIIVLIGAGEPYGHAVQAAVFHCELAPGTDARVVIPASGVSYTRVMIYTVRSPGTLVDTSWVVSIEVPDAEASPSAR
jgi:hypothetical protein